MKFLIKPNFNALRGAIYFETKRLNALAAHSYADTFGAYQQAFGVYRYMRLTNQLTYRLHYTKDTPFKWQPKNSCAWTPMGTMTMGQMEVTPCRGKVNEQHCYDEMFGSAYDAFLEWNQGGQIEFSDAGMAAVNAFTRSIMQGAALGARGVLVAGQLFDETQTLLEATPNNVADAFRATAGLCQGWIKLVRTLAASGYDHLETGVLQAADISNDGESYTGDVLALYDAARNAAPKKLRRVISRGGSFDMMIGFTPLWIVSDSIVEAVYTAYLDQGQTTATNRPRITVREIPVQTPNGTQNLNVYYIDNTAVIPASEVGMFDEHLTGTAHFQYLTLPGVIQLGGSFADIPALPGNVGMVVQQSTDVEDLGTYKYLSEALFAAVLNDREAITGDFLYAEPA